MGRVCKFRAELGYRIRTARERRQHVVLRRLLENELDTAAGDGVEEGGDGVAEIERPPLDWMTPERAYDVFRNTIIVQNLFCNRNVHDRCLQIAHRLMVEDEGRLADGAASEKTLQLQQIAALDVERKELSNIFCSFFKKNSVPAKFQNIL